MVTPAIGAVVLIPFPFSDLSQAKERPALVIVDAGRGYWILCQITSNPYGDPLAIAIEEKDFAGGSLQRRSYARPGKLFTANRSLMLQDVGQLYAEAFEPIATAIMQLVQRSLTH